jgi:hypothetical protein
LILIVLLSVITYISLPATLYFTLRLVTDPGQRWDSWAIGSLIAFVSSLVLGIILSTLTKCSLCHGTPLLARKCRKHTIANKLPFLSYRASSVLHLLFTGKFRCMYCSTPFRLGGKK